MLILSFILLQAMDALTTVIFLHLGVSEGNPLIRLVLAGTAGQPLGSLLALAIPKLFAIALGLFAWRSGRNGLLLKMDILFGLCVAWNSLAIILCL